MFAAATKGWALLLCAVPMGLNSCTMADKIHRATECTMKPLMSKPTASLLLTQASFPTTRLKARLKEGLGINFCQYQIFYMCYIHSPDVQVQGNWLYFKNYKIIWTLCLLSALYWLTHLQVLRKSEMTHLNTEILCQKWDFWLGKSITQHFLN